MKRLFIITLLLISVTLVGCSNQKGSSAKERLKTQVQQGVDQEDMKEILHSPEMIEEVKNIVTSPEVINEIAKKVKNKEVPEDEKAEEIGEDTPTPDTDMGY